MSFPLKSDKKKSSRDTFQADPTSPVKWMRAGGTNRGWRQRAAVKSDFPSAFCFYRKSKKHFFPLRSDPNLIRLPTI